MNGIIKQVWFQVPRCYIFFDLKICISKIINNLTPDIEDLIRRSYVVVSSMGVRYYSILGNMPTNINLFCFVVYLPPTKMNNNLMFLSCEFDTYVHFDVCMFGSYKLAFFL